MSVNALSAANWNAYGACSAATLTDCIDSSTIVGSLGGLGAFLKMTSRARMGCC